MATHPDIIINPGTEDLPIVQDIVNDTEQYWAHVNYYFDTQMGSDILSLSPEEKARCFQMFTDYADIFEKILPTGTDIIEHILGKRFAAANANPHEGINYDYDCPIIREYEEWKAAKE